MGAGLRVYTRWQTSGLQGRNRQGVVKQLRSQRPRASGTCLGVAKTVTAPSVSVTAASYCAHTCSRLSLKKPTLPGTCFPISVGEEAEGRTGQGHADPLVPCTLPLPPRGAAALALGPALVCF